MYDVYACGLNFFRNPSRCADTGSPCFFPFHLIFQWPCTHPEASVCRGLLFHGLEHAKPPRLRARLRYANCSARLLHSCNIKISFRRITGETVGRTRRHRTFFTGEIIPLAYKSVFSRFPLSEHYCFPASGRGSFPSVEFFLSPQRDIKELLAYCTFFVVPQV